MIPQKALPLPHYRAFLPALSANLFWLIQYRFHFFLGGFFLESRMLHVHFEIGFTFPGVHKKKKINPNASPLQPGMWAVFGNFTNIHNINNLK